MCRVNRVKLRAPGFGPCCLLLLAMAGLSCSSAPAQPAEETLETPEAADTPMGRGQRLFDEEKFEEARREFAEAVRLHPDDSRARVMLGRCRTNLGDHDGAIEQFNEVLNADPNNASALAYRGCAYGRQGKTSQAFADAGRAIELSPEEPDGYRVRSELHLQRDDLDSMIEDANKVVQLDPDDWRIYAARGGAFFLKSEFQRAIADMTAFIEHEPDKPSLGTAYAIRGNALFQASNGPSDLEKVYSDLTKARSLGSDIPVQPLLSHVENTLVQTGWTPPKEEATADTAADGARGGGRKKKFDAEALRAAILSDDFVDFYLGLMPYDLRSADEEVATMAVRLWQEAKRATINTMMANAHAMASFGGDPMDLPIQHERGTFEYERERRELEREQHVYDSLSAAAASQATRSLVAATDLEIKLGKIVEGMGPAAAPALATAGELDMIRAMGEEAVPALRRAAANASSPNRPAARAALEKIFPHAGVGSGGTAARGRRG